MGTISSGTGLISGLNIQDLVKQLIAIEARPLTLLKQRITTAQQQQTAYTGLSALLLGAKAATHRLAQPGAFDVLSATSSNTDVLTATADTTTPINTYAFQVKSLVTTQQLVSSGFADRTTTPVGAGTLTFETGQGNVAPTTSLSDLNGSQGVRRGVIRIVDRSGGSADIDLRTATDIGEVLDAINNQSSARVRASVRGDRLVITDETGLSTGAVTVSNLNNGSTATDLGIAGSSTTGEIVGQDVINLADTTKLARLNDGNGVGVNGAADDIRFTLQDGRQIDVNLSGSLRFATNLNELNDGRGVRLGTIHVTNRNGVSADVDLSGAQTVLDVVNAINASGISVSASLSGSKINIADTSGGTTSNLKIEDVSGNAAADLGILGDSATNSIAGTSNYRLDTIGGVLRAIRFAANNDGALSAAVSADGNGIVLTDNTVGAVPATVEALNDSKAAADLGLLDGFNGNTLNTRHLVAGLNTVLLSSLNGGSGVDISDLSITRQVGSATTTESIDVSQAHTLQDIIDAINNKTDASSNPLFHAEVSAGGTGITIKDIAGGTITALSGATATDLHLSADTDNRVAGGDLQFKYISDNTLLTSLNAGRGVSYSHFRITDSTGHTGSVSLNATGTKTIGDVIKAINNLGIGVTADINDTGDGIKLTDTAGGTHKLTVAEDGGTAAADLGILGTATGTTIDGSFARTVQIGADDKLDDVVAKINAANVGVKASVINDGTSNTPYRLVLTATTTGTKGKVYFDTGDSGISLNTLSEAHDAKLLIGDPNSAGAVIITSSSNTVKDVVQGLTLQLQNVSNDPVQVAVDRDADQAVTDINTVVSALNNVIDGIGTLTKFDPTTNQAGILLGDSTVSQIRDRLYARLTDTLSGGGVSLTRLSQVGLTVGSGAHLSFDESKFRDAFAADPDAVQKLFTLITTDKNGKSVKSGLFARLDQELDNLTNSGDGIITRENNTIQDRVDLFNQRATDMQALLDQRQARLTAQFNAMESALAALQGQQSALAALSGAASTAASSSKSLSLG